jgi:sugar-specific transcriptional regulator TrmB
MYKNVLQKFGLKSVEVDAYTLLLGFGQQPASVIAKKLQIKRTTARVYLENLVKLGLVKFNWKDRTQYFFAENPEASLEILEQNKAKTFRKLEDNLNQFAAIMPELSSMVRQDSCIPKVVFYEGIDELKRMYQDTLTSDGEILCMSSVDDLKELFGEKYDNWYVKKRTKKGIPLRYIAKNTPEERVEQKKDKKFLRKSKLLPVAAFGISNEINIYDNKVSIITLKEEKIGVLIESKEIYQTMKIIFELLWSI